MRISNQWIDNFVLETGGFGRYQIMLLIIIFIYGKLSCTWAMMIMPFAGIVPDWWCGKNESIADIESQSNLFMKCNLDSGTKCATFIFDDSMQTIVSEWNLVCDEAWVPSTIGSMQMLGCLISAVISGLISDAFGRKPILFISMLSLTILNVIAYFSVSWQMFAAVRFLLGFTCVTYLTVYYPLLTEFMPEKQRPLINALPASTLWAAVFGGAAWLIPNWRNLHITTAAVTFPFLLTWWIIPESFRWLLSKNRIDEAEAVITKMAEINKQPIPDTSQMKYFAQFKDKPKLCSIRDIFRGWKLTKSTILFSLIWLSSGYTSSSVVFGVQKLSGSVYMNMFLLSAVELPGDAFTYYLNNELGRKWTCLLFYAVSGIACFGVAITEINNMDQVMKGLLINGFALVTTIGNSAAWCSVDLLTVETYPTVVRSLGYGFQSTAARVGAIIAPKIVYLSSNTPGLMYFLCGGMMILSAICTCFVEETLGKPFGERIDNNVIDDQKKKKSSIFPGLMYFLCGGTMVLSAICALFLEETRDKPLSKTMDRITNHAQETNEI